MSPGRLALAGVLVGMLACGGAQHAGPQATCASAAANMRAEATTPQAGDADAFRHAWFAQAIEAVGAERCVADGWSREVIDCAATARGEAMDACLAKLSPAQLDAVKAAMLARAKAEDLDGPEIDEAGPEHTAPPEPNDFPSDE